MASINMGHAWADGSRIWLRVKADNSGPEALLQARLVATDAFVEMLNACINGSTDDLHDLDDVAAEFGIDLTTDD